MCELIYSKASKKKVGPAFAAGNIFASGMATAILFVKIVTFNM